MSILGIGNPYQFDETQKTQAKVWTFAHHVGVVVEDVLLSRFSNDNANAKVAKAMCIQESGHLRAA